jgi:putative transposase
MYWKDATVKYKTFFDEHHLYYVTCTIAGWKPLFTNPVYVDIVLQSLDWLRRYGHIQLFAFVVMPTHLHAIIKPLTSTANQLVQRFASYTAHEILRQLRQDSKTELLTFFQQAAQEDHDRGHRIWEEALAKNVYSEAFLFQKMEYIHNNPVDKDWHLVTDRADYLYSSACFYDRGEKPIIEVDDVAIVLGLL